MKNSGRLPIALALRGLPQYPFASLDETLRALFHVWRGVFNGGDDADQRVEGEVACYPKAPKAYEVLDIGRDLGGPHSFQQPVPDNMIGKPHIPDMAMLTGVFFRRENAACQ